MTKSKIHWINATIENIKALKQMNCMVIMAFEDCDDESFKTFFEYEVEHTSFFKNGYYDQMNEIDKRRFKMFAIIANEPYDN